MASRTKKFLAGLTTGSLKQIFMALVGLWLTPFLLSRIGPQDYGLWLVCQQILSYLLLLDLGIVRILPRETSYARSRAGTPEELTQYRDLVGETIRVIFWQLPFVALLALVVWLMLPSAWYDLRGPFALVLVGFVLLFPRRIFNAILLGLQDQFFLGNAELVSWSVGLILNVIFILCGWGLYALAIGWWGMAITLALLTTYRLKSAFPEMLPRSLPRLPWTKIKQRLVQGIWPSINQLANLLVNSTDVLLLALLLGPAVAVPYTCTLKVVQLMSFFPVLLMQCSGPALVDVKIRDGKERLREVLHTLSLTMLTATGFLVCLSLAISKGFVSWWVGKQYFLGHEVTILALTNFFLRRWSASLFQGNFWFGYERSMALTKLADGLVSFALAWFLVPWLGISGVMWALIISVCLICFPCCTMVLCRETNTRLLAFFQPYLPWLLRFLPVALASICLSLIWIPNSIPKLFIAAFGVSLIYLAAFLPILLRPPFRKYVLPLVSWKNNPAIWHHFNFVKGKGNGIS